MKELIRRDKFYRSRGSTATIMVITCSRCNKNICTYQKDGTGNLHRIYLDRIISSDPLFKIPGYNKSLSFNDLPNLVCSCRNIIAVPMVYKKEGRLAFRLLRGSIHKNKMR